MKTNLKLFSSAIVAAVIFILSIVALNSCQKEAATSSSLQTVSNASSFAKAAFESVMDTMAQSSLVAWYSFDSGSLKDRSKHHNDIIFSNATPVADRYGNAGFAYQFNGNGSYMQIKNSPTLNPKAEITLFAIVQVADFYNGPCHGNRIICKGNDDFGNGHYYLGFDDSYHTGAMNCSQTVRKKQENFNSSYGYAAVKLNGGAYDTGYVYRNRWYRVAFTYANGVSKMYVNGKINTYTNQSAVFNNNGQDLFLGKMDNSNYPYWFNGIMDEVAIFNKALSEEEIASLSKL